MTYRMLGEIEEDQEPAPRLSFGRRWYLTIRMSGSYWLVGLPMQLLTNGVPSPWWVFGGVVLTASMAFVEHRWLAPDRLRELECIEWLKSLPRTPDGNVLVDRAGWRKHFPRER